MKIDLFPKGEPNIKSFPGKKGDTIHFLKNGEKEVIISISRLKDEVITDAEQYSVDFLQRWYNFGFLTVIKKEKTKKNVR